MKFFKENIKSSFDFIKVFIKWFVIASLVGLVGGVVGCIFHESIDIATHLREEKSWIIFLLPIGGLVIAAIYSFFRSKGRIDTNRVLEAVRENEKVPFVMIPLIFVSTVITHLLGGSAGREGAALQLGGSIGYNIGKTFKLNKKDLHIIVMSGMSAVFSALFGTPLTAAFFAMEVVCVGMLHYAAIVPTVISAIVGYKISLMYGLSPVRFLNIEVLDISFGMFVKVAALSVLCALVSILFCYTIKKCEDYFEKWFKNIYVRAFVGGVIIVILTLLVRTYDYNGAGMDVIKNAMAGNAKYEAFLLKIIFTAITISAGFKGGEIVPTFFIGSTFGCILGPVLGLDAGFSSAIGFVALFCGVVNCPVASVMLALEVFGANGILFFALASGVSFMMSGYSGLYKSQKIFYSKIDDDVIDIYTK